ncbi:MAG: glycosyltransferase [Deinococcales bacterium]
MAVLDVRTTKRILIISASIGGGHRAAALALEEPLQALGHQVYHLDLLSYTYRAFRPLYSKAYFELVATVPDFVNWLGKRLDKPSERKGSQERLLALFSRMMSRKLLTFIRQYQPDIIVHTHFLPPAILSVSRKYNIPEAVVVTDYGAHSAWLQPGVGRYFVATEEMSAHLKASGVLHQRIRVSGIPIDRRYQHLLAKQEAREKLSLKQDSKVLLLMASGLEEKSLSQIIKQLPLIELGQLLEVVVVCGRSSHLYTLAQELSRPSPRLNIHLLAFTQDLPHYMAAADLITSKPGGLTTSEALAAGLPFAVIKPYPLQEEANTNFLLENGVGVRIEPLVVFSSKIANLLADETRLKQMSQRAKHLAKPYAAGDIIQSLLEESLPPLGANAYSQAPV